MKRGVMAVFRPVKGDIALFLEDGERNGCIAMPVEEARAIHDTLHQALRLADSVEWPIAAVPGARS